MIEASKLVAIKVESLLTTFYHMHHYTVQLLGRWSSVHNNIILYYIAIAIFTKLKISPFLLNVTCYVENRPFIKTEFLAWIDSPALCVLNPMVQVS